MMHKPTHPSSLKSHPLLIMKAPAGALQRCPAPYGLQQVEIVEVLICT